MKNNMTLFVLSLISMILGSIHVTQDIIRGVDTWGRQSLIGVLIFVVWLYGTLVSRERRWGFVVTLIGGLFAAAMPVIHYRVNLAKSGSFLFIWSLFAMGATGTVSAILSIRALRARE